MSSRKKEQAIQEQVVKETLARIAGHKGVLGYVVLHPKDGRLLENVGFGGSKEVAMNYAEKLFAFVNITQSTVRLLDFNDDLTFLRMRWRHREILIAPDLNKEYVLIVVHENVPDAPAPPPQTTTVETLETSEV